ncbi:2-oxoglutarate dehydrogenase complex dihydrolipoyllysine-residue succinyltransferase [Maritalea mediterranea]|uniref:Dihydrolipoyllysine-residue succinyltransferase component of 2-oxoglutarate dehydrogenase complex n=1 Tax=Maritalea mediterranea TaxID=2909667 RepID=A0ABS9EAX2_9HYPH|nr:2-oxoglutarate dehydrogenase complex dihydrolipoyllysine-residue succinyltransferase [Maritalea mediterranea]MCF4100013.1 2-oxoglutarate dehydrogenase complex dihydrolipoyllysine-residue succinyltransferase [Maritalea mediterranea]
MSKDIKVPTLGESVTEATIGQWFKKVGDPVKADEPIVELETDKVTIEVPAPSDGTLEAISAEVGETVEVGALIGAIGAGDGAAAETQSTDDQDNDDNAETSEASMADENKSGDDAEIIELLVPSSGESVVEADVGEWFKKVGDSVEADEAVVELETDKAAMDVPAPQAGKIVEIVAETGETVEVGAVLARIAVGEGAASAPAQSSAPKEESKSEAPSDSGDMPPAPSAQKMMKEKGVDAGDVEGSGKRGQILKEDVMSAVSNMGSEKKDSAPKKSSAPREAGEGEERVKMTRLRQTIARRLKDAQNTAAMLTTFNEVDMKPVMDLRKSYKELFEKKHGVKLGFMGFFTKAVCHALKEIPAVNAEIDGTDIIYKNFAHIGVAVGTDKGLVVPVVRDADQMSIAEIEQEIGRLGVAARDGELSMADMQGGTFTISNGGVYGSLMSTPILNAPQSGILGMHKIQERPVVENGEIVIKPMMYLALSYDHRIVDGKEAVTFLVRIKESLEDPQRLVLDL